VTPRNLHGKEGVDGSSPSEGSEIKEIGSGTVGLGGGLLRQRPERVDELECVLGELAGARTPEGVFACVTDPSHLPEWQARVVWR